MLSVCIVDTLGLSYDGSTLSKRGLGGSESAVILMAKELARLGFIVKVFNDCVADGCSPGIYDGVHYKMLHDIESEHGFDIYIGMRSVASFAPPESRDRFKTFTTHIPNFEHVHANSKYRVLWMHDTFCDGDDIIEDMVNQKRIDKIFTLSDWHTAYIMNNTHGPRMRNFEVLKPNIWQTRNGMQLHKDWVDISQKDPDLFVYNASITKGMMNLLNQVWPRVKEKIPAAKLEVVGGYYRMRDDIGPDENEINWHNTKEAHDGKNGVHFTGIIRQDEIADLLAKASYTIYPCAFPETFGISTLESLAYNTPVITNRFGALEETAVDSACYKIDYAIEPNGLFPLIDNEDQVNKFVDMVVDAYNNKYLHQQKQYACNIIKGITGWDTVALQWKQHFFKKLGYFLPVEEYREVQKINNKVSKVFNRHFSTPEMISVPKMPEQSIQIIIPVYNAEKYISKCLKSIITQDYNNYSISIIDDCSTDGTIDSIKAFVKENKQFADKFSLLVNSKNVGAVCNQINTIQSTCDDEDIVMLIDGDDWLVNDPNIFNMYNNLFHDGAEYCYGSCWSLADNIPLIAQPYPPEIKQNRRYRQHLFNWNMPYPHMRVFRASLANKLSHDLFKDENGNWFGAGGDNATFYNILEQANPDNVICVSDVVYVYNDTNPINDYKVNGEEQNLIASQIINKNKDIKNHETVVEAPTVAQKKRILIAIPTAKYIETDTFKSIYDLTVPEGYETEFQYFYGYNIEQIRNLIAEWAKQYDYLFSVDSDIVLQKDCLVKMLAHNVDMVSGVYIQRIDHEEVIEVYKDNGEDGVTNVDFYEIQPEGLHPVAGCGFGCVLINSDVIRKMEYPHFMYRSALSHAHTYSEDVFFCKKAKEEAGAQIFVDSSIICNHIGAKTYTPSPIFSEYQIQKYLRHLAQWPFRPEDVAYFRSMKEEKGIEPKVIYDIGSATCMWTREVQPIWPDAEIVMFDAMEHVEFLMKETGNKYHIGVLSDESNKEVDFYENVWQPGGNSYYREIGHSESSRLFTDAHKIRKITKTLDDVVHYNGFPQPDLIKIDVQGAELDVLKGAVKTLQNCKHILIEAQHNTYNEGAPHRDKVFEFLRELGFELEHVLGEYDFDGDYHFVKVEQYAAPQTKEQVETVSTVTQPIFKFNLS